MRGTDFHFVDTDAEALTTALTQQYEAITGHTVSPADPERLFIAWLADAIIKERVSMNFTGNMNIPSRATGEYLEALGEWIYGISRHAAAAAKCTVRFTISSVPAAVAIPAGTRVTDVSGSLIWATTKDVIIPGGSTSVDATVECQTVGEIGNGWEPGQIQTLVDVDNVQFFVSCANIDTTAGGSETESDEDYYDRMRLVTDSFSTAGSAGAYIYHAKSVSDEIADVKVVLPHENVTETVELLQDGNGDWWLVFGALDDVDLGSVKVGATSIPEEKIVKDGSRYKIAMTDLPSGAFTQTLHYKKVRAGVVQIYLLMRDGYTASYVIKNAVLAACNAENVRPLTDKVEVKDPENVDFNVDLTYYIPRETTTPVAEIIDAVETAVNEYIDWQSAKLGRDINPAKLWQLLMQTGIKRAEIREPEFRVLSDGSDHSVPQRATIAFLEYENGGYEDE